MARIEYLINNPQEVTSDDLDLLNTEIEKYPYFYSLRALKLLALKNSNDSSYEENLRITAVLSSNRKDLYNFINNITPLNFADNIVQNSTISEPISISEETKVIENQDEVVENIIETENLISEVENFSENEIQNEIIQDEVVENIIETENLISEVENFSENEIQNEVIQDEVVENIIETENLISEVENFSENEIQNEIIQDEVVENIIETENLIYEVENFSENEIIQDEVVENIIETENLISEVENFSENEIQNEIIQDEVVENIIETENLISEVENFSENEIQNEIIQDEVVENIIETENLISEVENVDLVSTQIYDDFVKFDIPETSSNPNIIDSIIENSLQVAEEILQKDSEISNAVSETLGINNSIDIEPKIEQISLVNRSTVNEIETENNTKPVSNINSFQVQNTYDVVKRAPTPINVEKTVEIENITEPEKIISPTEKTHKIELQNEVIENMNEIEISKIENNSESVTQVEIITKESQPIPTEETNKVVEEPTTNIESDSITLAEESINKVDFIQTNDSFSFNDWLKLPSAETMETEKEQKFQIIDEFLEKNPKITPLKKQEIPEAKTETKKLNETDFSYLMTETLAQVYIDQKQYEKAIRAYKILSLKYPEKNSLFAKQIKEIENLKNSK